MLNPKEASKSPLSSRIALSSGLLLAGVFGLMAAILLPAPSFKKTTVQTSPYSVGAESMLRMPREAGNATLPAPDTDSLVQFCSQHVTEKRTFVLFRRGTCVV